MSNVIVAGVGMTPFRKPGDHPPYTQMAAKAVRDALADAGLDYGQVQEAFAGHVYGDSTSGQAALYEVGMTGIPIVNVSNNCSTGSTALYLARRAIMSGAADCVLAVGFEQMAPGALGSHWNDRSSPLAKFDDATTRFAGESELPMAIRYFASAGAEHMQRYGTPLETFAKVRAKASRHAARNRLALFRKEVSAQDVLDSPTIAEGVMTRLMACPPTCGAAAAVLVSEAFAKRHGIDTRVRILSQALTTDRPTTFESGSMLEVVGFSMTREAARKVYEDAGIGPRDINVCELHDCFAQNEVISYEALGFCEEGEVQRFVDDGQNTYGGMVVTNPSGGLLSKGHPLGATGLAQCFELTQQLRGHAEDRQVQGARLALQHNAGIGGAIVVTLYGRHD
ncbi:MAG: lipid-transfer protein [Comamonas sp.]|uniref:lipid-transfer protein n=1 Tax=Comamonas sp. TaxID=34028 RepID=UPI002FC6CA50